MVRSAWIFFALCLAAHASCEYFSFGYPDVGNRSSELVYTTGSAAKMDSTSTWLMHLYKNPPGFDGGIVYKKTPVTTAHNGFTTKFTYAPTMCQLYFPSYAGGFAFFLTSSNISATPKIGNFMDAFGLNAMSDVIMAGYTVTTNEFMICNWTDAPTNTRLFDLCPRNPSPDPPYNCTGLNNANHTDLYEFTVIYDTKTLSIYVDDALKFSYPIKLQPISYTIGFAANIGVYTNTVYKQDITNWNFTSLDGPATESFKYDGRLSSMNRTAEQFTVIGSAQLKANSLQIVPSSQYVTGAVLLRGGVPAYRGFRTRFNWAASECNSDSNGDGFAFFVSQAQPTKGVLSSFGDGIGILNQRNSVVWGFSSFYNEFRYCNWDVPTKDWKSSRCTIKDNFQDPVRCDDHLIEIFFDGATMKMYYDGELVIYDNSLKLEKGLYFVGITGANGDSYFRQDITEWTFDTLPANYTFDYPVLSGVFNEKFDVFLNARWTPGSVMLTDLSQNQTGVVVTRTPFQAHAGFEITFDWVGTITKAVNSSLNGLTVFLSKTYPTARQVSESGKSGRGVLTLPNTYAIVMPMETKNRTDGYFSWNTEFSLCKWRAPYTSVDSMAMDCFNDTFNGAGIHTGTVTQFTIRYDGRTLNVFRKSSLMLSAMLTMDWGNYYIGIAATSSVGFMQDIRSLKFKSYQVDTQHRTFNIFNPGDMLLYSDAIIDYQLRLTNPDVGSVGAVVYPSKVDAYFGFQTTFSYKSTDCRSARTPPSPKPRPTGVTFFLSENLPLATDVARSTYGNMGIGRVPNIGLMVAYDYTTDYFYVCQWDTPLVDSFLRLCQKYSKMRGTTNDCDVNYIYNFVYDGYTLQIFENTKLLVTFPVKLAPAKYYVGFSSSSPYDQIGSLWINNWEYNYYSRGSLADQLYSEFEGNDNLVLLGDARTIDGKLVLTNDSNQVGAAFYPDMVRPSFGFNFSFVFLPVNCDPEYNGADGFTLFFTKQSPNQDAVLASRGGLLGIQQVPNVTMLAYSATYNEFFVANWGTPTTDLLRWFGQNIPNPLPKLACLGVYQFDIIYDDNLRIFINGNLVVSTTMNFDPVPYYVGLSGATGVGYWSQEFGNWQFSAYDLA